MPGPILAASLEAAVDVARGEKAVRVIPARRGWPMAFSAGPDGYILALMHEAPMGCKPPAA
jgi:hypothetical protein